MERHFAHGTVISPPPSLTWNYGSIRQHIPAPQLITITLLLVRRVQGTTSLCSPSPTSTSEDPRSSSTCSWPMVDPLARLDKMCIFTNAARTALFAMTDIECANASCALMQFVSLSLSQHHPSSALCGSYTCPTCCPCGRCMCHTCHHMLCHVWLMLCVACAYLTGAHSKEEY